MAAIKLQYTLLSFILGLLVHYRASSCVLDWDEKTFDCGNGFCVAMTSRCDTWRDCTNGRDEEDCPGDCPRDQHKCLITDVCIPKSKVCDGKIDCRWQDDEVHCDSASTTKPTTMTTESYDMKTLGELDFLQSSEMPKIDSIKDLPAYLDALKPWMKGALKDLPPSDESKDIYDDYTMFKDKYGNYDW